MVSEPIVHTTKAFNDSSVPTYCSMPTTALMAEPSIIPTMSITFIFFMRRDSAMTSSSIAAEPVHAMPVMPMAEAADPAVMPKSGMPSVNSATPRLAPELIPST